MPQSGQALAHSLKSNGNLEWLNLHNNNIGDRGAEVPALGAARWCHLSRDERQFGYSWG